LDVLVGKNVAPCDGAFAVDASLGADSIAAADDPLTAGSEPSAATPSLFKEAPQPVCKSASSAIP
jgi:hypothetical protein